jgi:hypothetical protein
MEKKIDKRFYLLSAINIVPAVILGGGATQESLILIGSLIVLVLNHTFLVKIVQSVLASANDDAVNKPSAGRILMLLGLKFFMLFGLIAMIYFYKKELLTKLFMIIFFQLIIQVVSIKNNYQNS